MMINLQLEATEDPDDAASATRTFQISRQALEMSAALVEMLTHCKDGGAIPIMNIPAVVVEKVVEYLEHHKDDKKQPAGDSDDSDDEGGEGGDYRPNADDFKPFDEWDTRFFAVEDNLLLHLCRVRCSLD